MIHACAARFDVTENLKFFFYGELNKAKFYFFCKINIIALSFVFNKYYPIMDHLGSKDSSRKLQAKLCN